MMIPRRTLLGMGLLGAAAAISVGLVCTPTTANPGVQARIGAAAPAFALTDTTGKSVSLADFKGKTVVLEWTNHDCPVRAQALQRPGHAGPAEEVDRQGRGLAQRHLVGSGRAGLRDS
jgi:cytochrome oxidase Cu insertion factor (SCO1/SenC/PrrC family)